ncbi:oligosaccharide flippase family protein [Halonotius sp. F2-221B]|uniref:oligosaccharide flippase family protein n=1 Tax=Halonotius sp. F2-221B TaxID=2731620 RepID=UPI00398A9067
MRLAKQSILYFVSDVGTSVIGFLAILYFARVLGSEPLGQYFSIIGLIAWATVPTNGLSAAINKRISEGKDADEIFSAATVINGAYGGFLFFVSILGGRYVNAYIGAEVNVLLASLLVINIIYTSTRGGLRGKKEVVTAGFLRTFDGVLRTGSQIALIYLGYNLLGLVLGHIAALVISAFVGVILFGLRPKIPSRKAFEDLYSYVKYSWLGEIKGKTFGWMDVIVLQLFVSSSLVGVYGVSWRLASALILVSNAVSAVIFPEVSDLSVDGNDDNVRDLLNEAMFFAGIFVIPGFFGVLAIGDRILRIYGGEFVEGVVILLILILARAVNVYGSQMLNMINGINRPDVAFRINLVFVVSNLSLNFGLVYLFSWYGAAVATATSSLVTLVLSYRSISRLLGKPEIPMLGILRQVASGGIMAVVLLSLEYLMPFWNMYLTIGAVLFAAFVYAVSLYTLSGRVREKTQSLVPL